MRPITTLFVANLSFSLFATLVLYILLPFLSTLMPEAYAGLVLAAGACLGISLFPLLPRLVARFGAQHVALAFAIAEMFTLLLLAAHPGMLATVLLIVVNLALPPLIYYQLDLLLEASTEEERETGRVRSIFLTAWNLGALAAPLLIAALLADSDAYGRIFLAAAGVFTPFLVLFAARKLPSGSPPSLTHLSDTLACMKKDRDLTAVTVAHILLYFFYVWAPFYIPAYLHNELGFAWSSIGWVFFVMLIPYVAIQYPAGYVADRWIGDKELMFAGFILAGGALAAVSLITAATSIFVITSILILTRIGAALVESTTEGHFFRRVSERDTNSVSIFRGIWPVANLIAPVAGSLILFFGDYRLLFALTGGFLLVAGIVCTQYIRDFTPRARTAPSLPSRALPS